MPPEDRSLISRSLDWLQALLARLVGVGVGREGTAGGIGGGGGGGIGGGGIGGDGGGEGPGIGPDAKGGRVVIQVRRGIQPDHVLQPEELDGVAAWRDLRVAFPGMSMTPVFGEVALRQMATLTERARSRNPQFLPADFRAYYYVDVPRDNRQRELVALLLRVPELIGDAYVDRPGPDPVVAPPIDGLIAEQRYRGPAPDGIDADHGATRPGGDGDGQHFIDFERGWTLAHQDLSPLGIPCNGSISDGSRHHGTAVLGVVCGQNVGGTGCRGIAPKATVQVYSYGTDSGRPDRLAEAAGALGPTGGTLLIEAQVYLYVPIGHDIESLLGPVEANGADFDVIRTATAAGIVVVEAAGNGKARAGLALDLDEYVNPVGRRVLDPEHADFQESGAILVTAATAPNPDGSGTPRMSLPYASFGRRIDCFAWGERIETCASDPAGRTDLYTSIFDGTSGASAIIAGAVVAILGAAAHAGAPLDPAVLRDRLRDEGLNTRKHPTETKRIGVMPNLATLI